MKIKNLIEKLSRNDVSHRLYVLSIVLIVLAIMIYFLFPTWQVLIWLLVTIGIFTLSSGFLLWSIPLILRIWSYEIGKIVVGVIHVFIFLISTVLARNLLSQSLGLPGNDFEMSVNFLTLILYIPVWLFAISLLIGISMYLIGFFESDKSVKSIYSGHTLGALGTVFSLILLLSFPSGNREGLYSLIRLLAFYSDYQSVQDYPGIRPEEKVCFHENGIISSANYQYGEVAIVIRKIDSN